MARGLLARYRTAIIAIVALILVSPLFGVVLADMVGYHEPLDVAAEKLGLKEVSIEWTPFTDYTVPGLPDVIGYIVCGFLGVAVILAIGLLASKLAGGR